MAFSQERFWAWDLHVDTTRDSSGHKIKVFQHFQHYKGSFKGVRYDSTVPPPKLLSILIHCSKMLSISSNEPCPQECSGCEYSLWQSGGSYIPHTHIRGL